MCWHSFVLIASTLAGRPMLRSSDAQSEPSPEAAAVRNLGDRRELFVDRFLIDKLEGAELTLERPCPEEVVLRFDQPWEGAFCGYATVLRDGPKFRLYYRGLP